MNFIFALIMFVIDVFTNQPFDTAKAAASLVMACSVGVIAIYLIDGIGSRIKVFGMGLVISVPIALFAAAMDMLSLPPEAAGVLSLITLGAGCTVSGFVCGCVKKSHGLRRGFRCALIMIAVIMTGALISGSLDGASAAAKCITAVICGCMGGVLGVNRVTER
jgi:putative membrane protein (TIGR04086 family)